MERITEAIVAGPLLPQAVVMAADAKYLQPSGLDGDEKLAGRRTIERLARAVVAEKIRGDEAEAIMRPVLEPDDDDDGDGWKFKERLTDDELRAFLQAAKAKVDTLGIVDEPFGRPAGRGRVRGRGGPIRLFRGTLVEPQPEPPPAAGAPDAQENVSRPPRGSRPAATEAQASVSRRVRAALPAPKRGASLRVEARREGRVR